MQSERSSDAAGPVVLVTGGTSGIGAACVEVFHADGYRVVTCSNEPEAGSALERRLNAQRPDSALFVECDVRSSDQLVEVVNAATSGYGRLDVLVNNVGASQPGRPLDELDLQEIDEVLEVNLLSCILTTRACLPHLRRTRGAIVNLGSVTGAIGAENSAIYAATKGAIAAFTKAVAIDEIRHGVRVNVVLPGNIVTASRERLEAALPHPQPMHDYIESWQWIGRSGTPTEVADVCLFLASDKASFVTGAELFISGGNEIGSGPKQPVTIADDGEIVPVRRDQSIDAGARRRADPAHVDQTVDPAHVDQTVDPAHVDQTVDDVTDKPRVTEVRQ
jgi:NAD(P)-dependent dehydrogenase (short-subunit alcohol dehydrogenase family)